MNQASVAVRLRSSAVGNSGRCRRTSEKVNVAAREIYFETPLRYLSTLVISVLLPSRASVKDSTRTCDTSSNHP
jgi:hypothetical protein